MVGTNTTDSMEDGCHKLGCSEWVVNTKGLEAGIEGRVTDNAGSSGQVPSGRRFLSGTSCRVRSSAWESEAFWWHFYTLNSRVLWRWHLYYL